MKICKYRACSKEFNPLKPSFVHCETCRKRMRGYWKKHRKNKKQKGLSNPIPGKKFCVRCLKYKAEVEFTSVQHRRSKLTKYCFPCRKAMRVTREDPLSSTGKCYHFWKQWKSKQVCVDCGCNDARVMEADHIRDKVHQVSYYMYWSSHGGPEAMEVELQKCEPRCRFCHQLKENQRRIAKRLFKTGTVHCKDTTQSRRRAELKGIKVKIGECQVCKRKVNEENAGCFDFDHRDEDTKICAISDMVMRKKNVYQHLKAEIAKCDLLCCNCHKIKTFYNEV